MPAARAVRRRLRRAVAEVERPGGEKMRQVVEAPVVMDRIEAPAAAKVLQHARVDVAAALDDLRRGHVCPLAHRDQRAQHLAEGKLQRELHRLREQAFHLVDAVEERRARLDVGDLQPLTGNEQFRKLRQ
jgi:hypothetical protein